MQLRFSFSRFEKQPVTPYRIRPDVVAGSKTRNAQTMKRSREKKGKWYCLAFLTLAGVKTKSNNCFPRWGENGHDGT
jgi:hypothetical protein